MTNKFGDFPDGGATAIVGKDWTAEGSMRTIGNDNISNVIVVKTNNSFAETESMVSDDLFIDNTKPSSVSVFDKVSLLSGEGIRLKIKEDSNNNIVVKSCTIKLG